MPNQENKGEQMPLQFLRKDKTSFEQIAHDHIGKHHEHQSQRNPDPGLAYPLVEGINTGAVNPCG